MKTITLTITLEVPDGTPVTVGSGGTTGLPPAAPSMGGAGSGTVPARPSEAPRNDADAPWPDMPPPDMTGAALEAFPDALVQNPDAVLHDHVAFTPAPSAWRCPDHGTSAKTVPAGTSKKNGKAYSSFTVCETAGCERRPGR